jgi:hypothetical protein
MGNPADEELGSIMEDRSEANKKHGPMPASRLRAC